MTVASMTVIRASGQLSRTRARALRAEFCGDTDADNRNPLFCKRQKSLFIILDGRHGGLWIYPLFVYHLLIEIPDADLFIFLKIMLIVKGNVERNYGDVFFLYQIPGKVTGTVADNMKCFTHME